MSVCQWRIAACAGFGPLYLQGGGCNLRAGAAMGYNCCFCFDATDSVTDQGTTKPRQF